MDLDGLVNEAAKTWLVEQWMQPDSRDESRSVTMEICVRICSIVMVKVQIKARL